MNKRKTLQELTIKDNFMFGSVMSEPENCKRLLELVLGFEIDRVVVDKEKSFTHNPAYKSIRLDVFAKDKTKTHYNVEMQVERTEIEKRSRYYHSQMDMDMIRSGGAYENLPNSYVIFICDFDPFGYEKYCYSFDMKCNEVPGFVLKEGRYSIFLSTKGTDESEVSQELVKFLKYVGAELEDSEADFGDDFVSRLQSSVRRIKRDRNMEEKHMVLEELLRKERREGREEGREEGRKEIAQEMLRLKMPLETIAEITKLSIEDLQVLTK